MILPAWGAMESRSKLAQNGYMELPDFVDAAGARALHDAAMQTRRFDASLFLSEAQWEAGPKTHKHTNPGPGYNVLEKLPDGMLDFVDRSPAFQSLFSELLGDDFTILSKRLICRLPWSQVPEWFSRRRFGKANNALGAFVHPQYRDISYYLDVDMHQDIHDYRRDVKERTPHYVTFYVYLDAVTDKDAPIQLLSGSHRFGATPFQHDVSYDQKTNVWHYRDQGRDMACPLVTLTGGAGYAALWHSCMLHGTPPVHDGHFRLSLRYLVARSDTTRTCGIDDVDHAVDGPLFHDRDMTPGANAGDDGFWNLRMNDYLRYSYRDLLPPG
jgi:hypothetical protein